MWCGRTKPQPTSTSKAKTSRSSSWGATGMWTSDHMKPNCLQGSWELVTALQHCGCSFTGDEEGGWDTGPAHQGWGLREFAAWCGAWFAPRRGQCWSRQEATGWWGTSEWTQIRKADHAMGSASSQLFFFFQSANKGSVHWTGEGESSNRSNRSNPFAFDICWDVFPSELWNLCFSDFWCVQRFSINCGCSDYEQADRAAANAAKEVAEWPWINLNWCFSLHWWPGLCGETSPLPCLFMARQRRSTQTCRSYLAAAVFMSWLAPTAGSQRHSPRRRAPRPDADNAAATEARLSNKPSTRVQRVQKWQSMKFGPCFGETMVYSLQVEIPINPEFF